MRDRLVDASQVINTISQIGRQLPLIVDKLLNELAKAIRSEARQVVPKDTGHLRQSIRYKKMSDGSYSIYAYTRWGDVSRDYAVIVHEDMKAQHAAGKSAKFIERPLLRFAGGPMAGYIAQELLRRLALNQSLAGAWKVVNDLEDDNEIMLEAA